MSETTHAFEGKSILFKHKTLSLYRPAAFVFAQTIADVPGYLISLSLYCVVIYFLAGLKLNAGSFFVYLLFTYTTTSALASFFRMIGAAFPTFEDASKAQGFFFVLFSTYCEHACLQGRFDNG